MCPLRSVLAALNALISQAEEFAFDQFSGIELQLMATNGPRHWPDSGAGSPAEHLLAGAARPESERWTGSGRSPTEISKGDQVRSLRRSARSQSKRRPLWPCTQMLEFKIEWVWLL